MVWAPDSPLWAPDSATPNRWAPDPGGHLTLGRAIDLFLAAKAAEGAAAKTLDCVLAPPDTTKAKPSPSSSPTSGADAREPDRLYRRDQLRLASRPDISATAS